MKELLQQKITQTEAFLKKELSDCSNQENLRTIMEYGVMNGGKRLRPVLLLGVYELFDSDFQKAVPYGCALEMIHCYSLIHDDLPSMDNDDLRRGKPTCHKKFSEFGAILAGDALLNLSYETMLKYAPLFEPKRAMQAMSCIAYAAGAKGMCAGQMTDMEQSVTNFESLLNMHRGKTGALLKAAVVSGGILGGASPEVLSVLEQYADNIGLIFQMQDDILDVVSDEVTLGKPIHSDEKNHKITFVSEHGIETCRELMAEYENQAILCLERVEQLLNISGGCAFLKDLTLFMAHRNH